MSALVDAHLHFWEPASRHYDWLRGNPVLQRRFGPEDLEAGGHEVLAAVFVQADARDEESLDEVRWVTALSKEHPWIRGIVAYAPVHTGRAVEPQLEVLAAESLVVGVRRLLQGRPSESITEPSLVEGIRLLCVYGLAFDICVTSNQLPAVAVLVEACPQTTFVLDHLGKPPVASGRLDPWREDLARIAAFPNVHCKLSGLATEAAPGWHASDVRPFLEHAIDVFGPSRCMIGSDWPVATQQTTVGSWFDMVLGVISGMSEDDRRAVLGGTAVATYRLEGPPLETLGSGDARGAIRR